MSSTSNVTNTVGAVSCVIEVYPFEGGAYTLTGGLIPRCEVTKTIRGAQEGSFHIALAPGSPLGIEAGPTWTQIITPGSLALIGMQRGAAVAITMVGLIVDAYETQHWESNIDATEARRTQVLEGRDLTWFFSQFSWGAMIFLALSQTLFGLPAQFAQGSMVSGSPSLMAQQWFNFMTSPGSVLGGTRLPYTNGARIPLVSGLRTVWERHPAGYIPSAIPWIGAAPEGSWSEKFTSILNPPWYEFFVVTAPVGAYDGPSASGQGIVTPGYAFSMPLTLPAAPAVSPTVVGRVSPLPLFTLATPDLGHSPAIGSMDMARWNALTLYDLSAEGFYESNVGFTMDTVRNFYSINSTVTSTVFGNNAAVTPLSYAFFYGVNAASIHRYGYQPEMTTTNWFYDPYGLVAQQSENPLAQTLATLLARVCSNYEPLPLMAKAELAIPLRPDILPGFRFRYRPFKGQAPWDFYIESVSHSYAFAGRSVTHLLLTRGLPSTIYADASDGGLLKAIHTGNARRDPTATGGLYQIGPPTDLGGGLTFVTQPGEINALFGQIASNYVTPQTK